MKKHYEGEIGKFDYNDKAWEVIDNPLREYVEKYRYYISQGSTLEELRDLARDVARSADISENINWGLLSFITSDVSSLDGVELDKLPLEILHHIGKDNDPVPDGVKDCSMAYFDVFPSEAPALPKSIERGCLLTGAEFACITGKCDYDKEDDIYLWDAGEGDVGCFVQGESSDMLKVRRGFMEEFHRNFEDATKGDGKIYEKAILKSKYPDYEDEFTSKDIELQSGDRSF